MCEDVHSVHIIVCRYTCDVCDKMCQADGVLSDTRELSKENTSWARAVPSSDKFSLEGVTHLR